MCQHVRTVLCLTVLLVAHSCFAIPGYWLDPSKNPEGNAPESVPGCLDHPKVAYGLHGAPVEDMGIKFVLMSSAAPVMKVCPGATYSVQLETPTKGLALLTASVGTFSLGDATCPGRVAFDDTVNRDLPHKSAVWTSDLTVPCTATGSMKLAATYAANKAATYNQNSATITVDATCAASSCSTKGGPAANTTSTSPPATTTRTTSGNTPAAAPASSNSSSNSGTRSTAAPSGLGLLMCIIAVLPCLSLLL